jgi:hypothetical protein
MIWNQGHCTLLDFKSKTRLNRLESASEQGFSEPTLERTERSDLPIRL